MPTELRSPRLVLRPVGREDVPALHAHWTEPEVRRFLWDGHVVPQEQVGEVIETSHQLFEEHGAGLWAIRLLHTGALIGCGGFWHFHEPPELELLLSLSRSSWGRGFAQEAAGLLLAHAFDDLGWPAVQGSADAPNATSLKLMRRLDMGPAGNRPGEFGTIDVYRLTREEWRRATGPPDLER